MYSSCQSEVRHTAEAKDALAISLLTSTLWQTLATPRSCPISFFFLFFFIFLSIRCVCLCVGESRRCNRRGASERECRTAMEHNAIQVKPI